MHKFGSIPKPVCAALLLLLALLPQRSAGAQLTTLFDFPGTSPSSAGGINPLGAPLFDASGAVYGTTSLGGTGCKPLGCGTVFKLTPPTTARGRWQESVLYSFRGGYLCGQKVCFDGDGPAGDLVTDFLRNALRHDGARRHRQ